MDIYPQLLAGPARGNFTPIFGKAGIVDRPLVRMHDQPRQTVLTIFVPKESNQFQSKSHLLHESHCMRQ